MLANGLKVYGSMKDVLMIVKIFISKRHVRKNLIISYACMFKLNTIKFKS
jgi:hypothetical protein